MSRETKIAGTLSATALLALLSCGEADISQQVAALAAQEHECSVDQVEIVEPRDLDQAGAAVGGGTWVMACGYLRHYALPGDALHDAVTAESGQLAAEQPVDVTGRLSMSDVPTGYQRQWLVSVHKDVDMSQIGCPYLECVMVKGSANDDAETCAQSGRDAPVGI